MTTEQFLQAQELYNQGKSFTEVGKEVGFSRQAGRVASTATPAPRWGALRHSGQPMGSAS